jgi:hypothetical protein
MKKILTLSLLLISLGSLAQKIDVSLNLKLDSTYYLTEDANLTIIQDINGQEQMISTLIGARVAHKVIAINGTVYQMEIQYLSMNMHVEMGGKKIDFDSNDKDSSNIFSKIMASVLNKPFLMTIDKKGKVLEIKNSEELYLHMFDNVPQISEEKKAQFKTQMEQSFGAKAFKSNFQDAFAMLPPGKVGPGDTWVTNNKMESVITEDIKTTYTLQGITDDAILINGDAVVQPDNNTGFKQLNGMSVRVSNINGTATSKLKLDKNTGWISEAKVSKVIKSTVEIQASPKMPGGMTFPMSVNADIMMSSK